MAHSIDVRLHAIVGADGDPAAEVGRRADLPEVMIAAELAVGVLGDSAKEQIALHVGGPAGLVEERPGQPARTDLDRMRRGVA